MSDKVLVDGKKAEQSTEPSRSRAMQRRFEGLQRKPDARKDFSWQKSSAVQGLGYDLAKISITTPSSAGRTVAKLQTKLAISRPGDEYEQEADRVAEQMMRMPEGVPPSISDEGDGIVRKCPMCRGDDKMSLRTKEIQVQVPAMANDFNVPPIVDEVLSSPGRRLDAATRAFMEPRFGHVFGEVKVHTDTMAAESARAVNALAYTVGPNIVFGSGSYSPETNGGKRLLAHELTHVIQQSNMSTSSPPLSGSMQSSQSLGQDAESISRDTIAGLSTPPGQHIAAKLMQRKARSNLDAGHWTVSKDLNKFKPLFVLWRSELTDSINNSCGSMNMQNDYRFVLMLAQRMVEQDGPRESAEGNNPYNVMGNGDADPKQFRRENNIEIVNGKRKKVPANFANYSSESMAHDAYLMHLKINWPMAFNAIATGGSIKDFIDGLYPGWPNNYATASHNDYMFALRLRSRMVVGDLYKIYSSYLRDYQSKVTAQKKVQAPTDSGNQWINEYVVILLNNELTELDALTDRLTSNQPVNSPISVNSSATP
jgi:hypothetical protein